MNLDTDVGRSLGARVEAKYKGVISGIHIQPAGCNHGIFLLFGGLSPGPAAVVPL
jgi:hypothetical protein